MTTKFEIDFQSFILAIRHWEMKSNHDQDALSESTKYDPGKSTRELALDLNTAQSVICRHLKKIRKVSRKIF